MSQTNLNSEQMNATLDQLVVRFNMAKNLAHLNSLEIEWSGYSHHAMLYAETQGSREYVTINLLETPASWQDKVDSLLKGMEIYDRAARAIADYIDRDIARTLQYERERYTSQNNGSLRGWAPPTDSRLIAMRRAALTQRVERHSADAQLAGPREQFPA